MQRREFLEIVSCAGLAIMSFAVSAAANAQGQLLRNAVVIDDEFRGYFIDVYGGGANARVDEALRVHSCKTDSYRGTNVDQLFQWVDDFMGRVTMPEYNRCMEATALEPGCRPASAPAWISLVYQAREIEIVENIAYASVSGRCARMNERMWRTNAPACHSAGQESSFRRRARHRGFSLLGSPRSLIGYQRLIDADDVGRA